MMELNGQQYGRKMSNVFFIFVVGFIFLFTTVRVSLADIIVNIFAVNGTEETQEKDINFQLPSELKAEDILDTQGLDLEYNVNEGAYFVKGKIELGPKESKTIKIRAKDIWKVDEGQVDEIKKQIETSLKNLEDSEYYNTGKIKKDSLNQRLDFILQQQERFSDNVERRMDQFRTYADELNDIRNNSVSVKYWRSKPPAPQEAGTVKFTFGLENVTNETVNTKNKKHYLPSEVKPEHIVELQGFEVRYDALQGKSYLSKEEELKPGESKRYSIDIVDVWNIDQQKIDNLKDRTRKAYKLLENTKYVENANFLVANIKKNLEGIEKSQEQEKEIREHISAFRFNEDRFDSAKKDVKTLEEILDAVREELERSPLRNVLQRIKSLKSLADIAEAIIGKKPSKKDAWKWITGIIIFVGVVAIIHFAFWGARSKGIKEEDLEEKGKPQEEAEE